MKDFKNTPLWNNRLSVEERLDYLIAEMTLEEKIRCLTTGCPAIERLGIFASHLGGEAAHGIEARHDQAFNRGEPEPTTSFTQPIGMSSSFDRELIRECGRVVGEEARALFGRNKMSSLCRWAPTIDMERDPRWGRTEEAYGEDPYLTGEMASAYIRGMKGEDPFYIQCGATLKHFYANNVEDGRVWKSSSVDERNKYEYYLEPFRKAVEEGGAEAIMTAYNEINGVPAILNREVQELTKDKWGLVHVVCDGGDFSQTVDFHKYFETHAETLAYGLKAGVDCFTDSPVCVEAAAREALEKGLISEEDINRSVRNSFRTRIRLGFFDGAGDCPYNGMGEEYLNNEEHGNICRRMAEESVVLLKNKDSLLPLNPKELTSMAVVGPLADAWYPDWYGGMPPYKVTALDGIKKEFPQTNIAYHSGLSKIRLHCGDKFVGLSADGRLKLTEKEQAEVFLFTDWGCGSATLVAESNGKYVTLEEGSYLIKADKEQAFGWFIRESWNFKELSDKEHSFYLDSWNGRAVRTDDEGYLVVIKEDDSVRPGEGDDAKLGRISHAVSDGKPCIFGMEIVEDGIAKAVEAAMGAEKAVVVLGCNPVINSKEEIDRTTLALPPTQQKLADAVLKANPNTIVVMLTNYPYAINRLQETVPAILCSASGSQEQGSGIAAVLSGRVNPAGRLPMTWYRSDNDLPDINDYDIIKGKRTYRYFEDEVLYPFGYGLSYTEFKYEDLKTEAAEDAIKVTFYLTNLGKVAGDEVVQVYVHKENSRVKQPVMELKAFDRIKDLQPGERRKAEFIIKRDDLRYFDVISGNMIREEGDHTFMVGACAKDIRLQETVFLSGTKAGSRDAFSLTQAFRYDDYENCFIHRAFRYHNPDCATCMIPGKANDEPDIVDNSLNKKINGVLSYRDMEFKKLPEQICMKVCGVEEGEVRLSLRSAKEGAALTDLMPCVVSVSKSDDLEFEMIIADIPESFIRTEGVYELTIEISGKIKLAEFCFLSDRKLCPIK